MTPGWRVLTVALVGAVVVLILALPLARAFGKGGGRRGTRGGSRAGASGSKGTGAGGSCPAGTGDASVIDRVEFSDVSLLHREVPDGGLRSIFIELAQLDATSGIFGSFKLGLGEPISPLDAGTAPFNTGEGFLLEVDCHPQGFKRGGSLVASVGPDFVESWAALVKKSGIDLAVNGLNEVGNERPDLISKFSIRCRYADGAKLRGSLRGKRPPREAVLLVYDLVRSIMALIDDPKHPMSKTLRATFRDV